MSHKKPNLPTKICATCARPFTWRKRWEACWESVRYCSDVCRGRRGGSNAVTTGIEERRPKQANVRPTQG